MLVRSPELHFLSCRCYKSQLSDSQSQQHLIRFAEHLQSHFCWQKSPRFIQIPIKWPNDHRVPILKVPSRHRVLLIIKYFAVRISVVPARRVWTERSIGFSAGGQRIYPVALCGQTPSTAMGDWICSISSRSRARRTACGSSRWAGRRATRCRRVLPRAIDDKVGSRARGLPSPTCLGKNQ